MSFLKALWLAMTSYTIYTKYMGKSEQQNEQRNARHSTELNDFLCDKKTPLTRNIKELPLGANGEMSSLPLKPCLLGPVGACWGLWDPWGPGPGLQWS